METVVLKKITSLVSGPTARLRAVAQPLFRVFSLSLADDLIAPAKAVTVSIEKGMVSVVCGSRFLSKSRIKGYRLFPQPDRFPTPEALASSVLLALNQLGVSKTDVTLNIPKAWAIVKVAQFPSSVKDSLADIVSYELDRLTPFTAEEALYDFQVISEDSERVTIAVIAAKYDALKPYITALTEKGLSVRSITTTLSSIGTLCRYLKHPDCLFLQIDESTYEGAVFSGGDIKTAFRGDLDPHDERSTAETIRTEASSIAESLPAQDRPREAVLLLKDRRGLLREIIKTTMPLPFIFLDEAITALNIPPADVSYGAIGATIESLWPKAKRLNLITRGRHEKPSTPLSLTIGLLVVIAALWLIYSIAPVSVERENIQELDRQILARKEEVRKVEALKQEIELLNKEIGTIDRFKEEKPLVITIVKELATVLPKSAWLSRVRITDTAVDIEGYATSATEILPKLEASKYFGKAEFASPTFRDMRMNADRFNIKMEISDTKKTIGEQTPGGKK